MQVTMHTTNKLLPATQIHSIFMGCQSGKQMHNILTHTHVCCYIHVVTVYTLTVTFIFADDSEKILHLKAYEYPR